MTAFPWPRPMPRPLLPGVLDERVLPIGREVFRQFPALVLREAGADADVLQRARIVEQTEQQRADKRALALFVPSKAGDDAVAIALVLDLEHDALVGLVGAGYRLWRPPCEAPP